MRGVSRRRFLAATTSAGQLAAASRGTRLAAPREEFRDALTEREIYRLTDPSVLHHLPSHHHRFIARDNSFLLLAAEHAGTRQLYRLELKRDRLTQVTDGTRVHPYAAHLRNNDRGFYFLQDRKLIQADLGGGSRKTLYECADGWILTGDMDISRGERYAALVEMRESDWRPDPEAQFESQPQCRIVIVDIRVQASSRSRARLAAEERRWLSCPRFRPWRAQVLYSREGPWQRVRRRLQIADLDGSGRQSVRPTRGSERLEGASWLADGSRLRYVLFPDGEAWSASMRSLVPESRDEVTEASCSAFGWFKENGDGSAIVGASLRPSGPNLYVLFPRMRREITLGEHASSLKPYPVAGADGVDANAAVPQPALSDDSSWLYFVTDREGLPALYAMPVDDLVESTKRS